MDLGLNPAPKKEWKPDLRPPIQLNSPQSTTPQARPGAGYFPPSSQSQLGPGPCELGPTPPRHGSAGTGNPVLSEKAEKDRQKLLKKLHSR